ncbi:MAG: hypothetical protein ACR2ID_06605 [Chthoniobacterales bacterium]
MSAALHLNLDDAWPADTGNLPLLEARPWGPQLRFTSPASVVERFFAEYKQHLGRFMLYGSGDFHFLTALWLRRVEEPVVVVSFDNHPDWDVRPPRWACGGWVNRALELPHVRAVSVWGCGGAECWWPGNIFANHRAPREKLEAHPWADERPSAQQNHRGAILRSNWRSLFEAFVGQLNGGTVYITIDLDCLTAREAVTNWDAGRFTAEEVAWALGRLQAGACVVGGDLCGAFSMPHYARWKQKFAAEWDHPQLPQPSLEEACEVNRAAFEKLWPALVGGVAPGG